MGGRANAGNTKLFSNIDAARNAPLRATRTKEIETDRAKEIPKPTEKTAAFADGNYLKNLLKKPKSAKSASSESAPRSTASDGEISQLRKLHAIAEKKSAKFAEARSKLPPGSSRAKVTTANARWMRAAEERDRLAALIREKTG